MKNWHEYRVDEMEQCIDNSFNSFIYKDLDNYNCRGFDQVSERLWQFITWEFNSDFHFKEYMKYLDNLSADHLI